METTCRCPLDTRRRDQSDLVTNDLEWIDLIIDKIVNLKGKLQAAIEDLEVKNAKGTIEFRVLDENRIKVPNKNRDSHPNLKLSLHGVKIVKVHSINATEWTLELSDHSNATFAVEEKGNVTEYYFQWFGGGQNERREVCFHYGYNDASWYNAFYSEKPSWPMDTSRTLKALDFTLYYSTPSNQKDLNYIIEYLFLNSDGFALLLDQFSPLFIRRNGNEDDPLLCFSVNNTNPYMTSNNESAYLDINIRLFAGKDTRSITDYVVHDSGLLPKPTEIPDENKFKYPTWGFQIEEINLPEQSLANFAEKLLKYGFPVHSEIFIRNWENQTGCFCFDTKQFPHHDQVFTNLTNQGFRLLLTISPNVDVSLENNHINKFLVNQDRPRSTEIVDFSNPEAREWFSILLKKFYYEQEIDSFFIQDFFLSAYERQYQYHDLNVRKNPNLFVPKYIETVAKLSNKMTSLQAFRTQHLPIFTILLSTELNAKQFVSNILAVSIGGYSFTAHTVYGKSNTTEEHFIRMIQATSLLPSVFLIRSPFKYSQKAVELTKKFIDFHHEHAQILIDLAKKRVRDGSPIIRPMWYVYPDDAKAYKIEDQFMLGDDILVAPVLAEGQRDRTVYFPNGDWIDQHGKTVTGPKELKVAAPLEELPFFKRKV